MQKKTRFFFTNKFRHQLEVAIKKRVSQKTYQLIPHQEIRKKSNQFQYLLNKKLKKRAKKHDARARLK